MDVSPNTFTDLCVKALELCALKEGEVMAVLTQGDEKLDYADAMLAAGEKLHP
jgi:2,5-dihydroxypyridine 5,6-dioxygenase